MKEAVSPVNAAFLAEREAAAGCDVSEIVRSMFREQRDHEHVQFGATYMKYRKVVAEWMVDVCEYFTLHSTTTHAAIAYLDRLQPNEKFSRFEWQMLAICCILIASKYNECEDHVPDLSTLEEITQQSIPNETVLNYELWALKRMGWKLNARTPMAFLSSYIVLGTVLPTDVHPRETAADAAPLEDRVKTQLQALANKCTLDVRFKGFRASDVAGAILFCTRRQLGISPAWGAELSAMTMTDPLAQGVVQDIAAMIDALSEAAPPAPPSKEEEELAVSGSLCSTPVPSRSADGALTMHAAEKAHKHKASPTTIAMQDDDEEHDDLIARVSLSN